MKYLVVSNNIRKIDLNFHCNNGKIGKGRELLQSAVEIYEKKNVEKGK